MKNISLNSFDTRAALKIGSKEFIIFRLDRLRAKGLVNLSRLPVSLRILLESLLRLEDGSHVKKADIEALASWQPGVKPEKEIAFTPARVILQDFTGVPSVVDLAAMRDAIKKMGGDPKSINPLQPVDLVIDHSVQVDFFGSPEALGENARLEFERNQERYQFLRWGQQAFRNFRVVPPDTGIVHQVNLEYLAQVVFAKEEGGRMLAYPDTLVGTDSHTTMINGLGVLGWGVGGIEAEAAMLGQPISMLIPEVVGFKLSGKLREGTTATDLVLTITQMLRKKGVVGKFVEFYGAGLDALSLPDRATLANMCPEYGATVGFFPVDQETLNYLRLSGRDDELVTRVEVYMKEQGLFRTSSSPEPLFSDQLELDLGSVEPSLAGPKRPQDRVALRDAKRSFEEALPTMMRVSPAPSLPQSVDKWFSEGGSAKNSMSVAEEKVDGFKLEHGSIVIAAITSCTNTSNPAVMMAAGLLAKKAVERGLSVKPWVKTSLAPGSKVVVDYLREAKLLEALEKLKFHLVGFGCTTCIGNSGPLPEEVARQVKDKDLVAAAVLSGNRNFEGRIHPLVRANYLASPPLVVAYAIAGTMKIDLSNEALGQDRSGCPVYLKDVWPSQAEINRAMSVVTSSMFRKQYGEVFKGDSKWQGMKISSGDNFNWDPKSTYVKHPPYFNGMPAQPRPLENIQGARALVMVGDSVTTDHISPAGSIAQDSPAGQYLISQGVSPKDFNSYGARRGNHEVMMRGTFANVRLKNLLASGLEGCWTRHFPEGEKMTIFDAAMKYQQERISLIVIAGKEYGSGSSRDWAAKGPALLGVKAVLAESFERIHRSNLIGMGVLPLEFETGQSRQTLALTGEEIFEVSGIAGSLEAGKKLKVSAKQDGSSKTFTVTARIDTPEELAYYQHGGILLYVLRQLVRS